MGGSLEEIINWRRGDPHLVDDDTIHRDDNTVL